jgi:hypothetical protein
LRGLTVFMFDNSSNHGLYAPDALRAQDMNLGPGGKQRVRRAGRLENGEKQEMQFPDDYPDEKLRGKPKGIKRVLEERGLWRPSWKLQCAGGCSDRDDRCARRFLSQLTSGNKKGGFKRRSKCDDTRCYFTQNSTVNSTGSNILSRSQALHSGTLRLLLQRPQKMSRALSNL